MHFQRLRPRSSHAKSCKTLLVLVVDLQNYKRYLAQLLCSPQQVTNPANNNTHSSSNRNEVTSTYPYLLTRTMPERNMTHNLVRCTSVGCQECMNIVLSHPPLQDCTEEECCVCSVRDCPYQEPFHHHHDGCPICHADKNTQAKQS